MLVLEKRGCSSCYCLVVVSLRIYSALLGDSYREELGCLSLGAKNLSTVAWFRALSFFFANTTYTRPKSEGYTLRYGETALNLEQVVAV
jgi:hypothetical protein